MGAHLVKGTKCALETKDWVLFVVESSPASQKNRTFLKIWVSDKAVLQDECNVVWWFE